MDISTLQNQLQFAIPTELYKIEPGQIILFSSKSGLTQRTANTLADFFRYLRRLDKDNNISINVVQTENDLLIDTIVGRRPEDTEVPYKVFVGNWDTVAGFAADYFGDNIDDVISKVPSVGLTSRLSINDKDLPVAVSINPDDCSSKRQLSVPDCSLCPYMGEDDFDGMQAIVEDKNKPSSFELENKISVVLADCQKYGYDVDTVGLKDKIRNAWEHPIEYTLELDIQEEQWLSTNGQERIISVCDIYIEGNGEKHLINLRPAEKALYLTNILRGGFPLADMSIKVINDMAAIFKQIPGHQTKSGGLVYKNQSISGIGVMKKRIRDAFAIATDFGPDVENLAMEGFRGKDVSIRKATDKHREQIKKYFGL